jgi:uncharacterized SAM-binding protein YcdF (DUF218 family)
MEKTAIVILGAPNDETGELSSIAKERCHQAMSDFRTNAGSSIIPTGGWGEHFNTTSQPHGHYSRAYLVAHGVPEEAFVECVESSNTVEDARLCRPLVERYGFRRLVVVTSDFHVARAQFLFTREFPDIALTFSGARTHLPEEDLQKRILHEQKALARLRGDS